MSKLEQILNIDPASELHFRGPFTEVVSSTIKLHNPSDKKVCFKVKTTAPKKYCVRPNSGIVAPQQTVNVAVMLQPHDFDPKEKSKHKFMVQSMIAQGNVENLENIWKEASADQIIDAKLKCVFDMPEENLSKAADPIHEQSREQSGIVAEPNITATNNSAKEVSNENEVFGTDVKTMTQQPVVISEDKSLKADNQRLKDEINVLKTEVRQRQTKLSQSGANEPTSTTMLTKNEPESQMPPILYLIIALFIGILIGKIIL